MIVYANDTTLRDFCLTILANNYISLSEGKWNEMKKLNSEGNNEYQTKSWALKLAVFIFTVCQQFKKNNNSKNSKATAKCCKQNQENTRLFRRIIRVLFPPLMFSFASQYLVSKNFHFKSKNTIFRQISLQDFPRKALPWPWSGDRKILPAPGTNQIAGLSGYRPLTIKEINNMNL